MQCVTTIEIQNGKCCIRGHLKSSHIADKRKNFHMALYPLPPSSNESVIDNGEIIKCMADVQIYFKDRLWRLTKAFTKCSLSIEGTGFQWNPHSSSQPAQTMSSVSRMQGRLPGGSASIAKRTIRQSQTVEEEYMYDFYSFFSFSAC